MVWFLFLEKGNSVKCNLEIKIDETTGQSIKNLKIQFEVP